MTWNENLDVFLSNLDVKDVVFHTKNGSRRIQAYFDNAFLDVTIGETVLDTTQPRLTCKHADVRDITPETSVDVMIDEVEMKKFSVIQIQPEGTGFATVTLAHES